MTWKPLNTALAAAIVTLGFSAALAQPYPPPPPPPPGAPMAAPALDACRADAQRFCQGIRPGAGRIRACMRSNQDRISPGCRAAITGVIEKRRQMREQRRQQWGAPRPGMPNPPPPPPPPPGMAPIPN